MRVSSAKNFSDPNEMIGYIFANLASPMWTPFTREGLRKAQNEVSVVRESHYVSCWTRARDSIAMWEIYSPHQNGVQIEADQYEVEAAFKRHVDAAAWVEAHHKPPNWDKTVFYPAKIVDCRYENLGTLAEKIKNKTREAYRRSSAVFDGKDLQGSFSDFHNILNDINNDPEYNHTTLFSLKDQAYRHEQEVRFCLHAMRRNDLDYEVCAK